MKIPEQKRRGGHPHAASSVTDLIDFHEFGVGAWPLDGHLDDVRGRRHGEPRQRPTPVELGSCGVDGRTCLPLGRNDKKKSRSVPMQGEFCFITSCFHWWLRDKKRLGAQHCRRQVPRQPLLRREANEGQGPRPGGTAARRRALGTDSQEPLTPVCCPGALGLSEPDPPSTKACEALTPNSLRKDRLPRKSRSGSSVALKCSLRVTNRLRTIATRMS